VSHRIAAALVALVAACTLAAGASAHGRADPLSIYAAASLTEVFGAFDPAQRYNFAGSNALETQIRNGAPADIFASAAPLSTQRLFRANLVDRPVTFTTNRLVLIVPRSNPAEIRSIYDNYGFKTQILAASLRSPTHVVESALAGAHIGTMPFKVLDSLFSHPLTDKGLEQFLKDWNKVFQETPVGR